MTVVYGNAAYYMLVECGTTDTVKIVASEAATAEEVVVDTTIHKCKFDSNGPSFNSSWEQKKKKKRQ